jgi:hypothetical protein
MVLIPEIGETLNGSHWSVAYSVGRGKMSIERSFKNLVFFTFRLLKSLTSLPD